MSEEEPFTESEEGSDFSASEEEWKPSKDSKKKKGVKKSKHGSTSEEDETEDDDSGSEDDSDLEDFAESSKKKKSIQTGVKKRPAPKTSSKAGTGGKRKRPSQGLRDRLYLQYKNDLLKEIAPARPPPNSSVSDILKKCQYQRKESVSVGNRSKAEESDSSGNDHLVDPEKLDLRSTFFNKHSAKSPDESGPPQFDVNAGLRLSDSSDGEEQETERRPTGEELLPVSIPKQAAVKLISHINQQSGEFMNFHNLDQFTAKLEEAKQFLKSYQANATEHRESGTAEDKAALAAAKENGETVSNLLALGETDVGATEQKVQSNDNSDSDWEEVETGAGQEDGKADTEQKPKDVTIEMDTAQSRRKRREDLEMELYIKRQINKVKRANQMNYHKSSVLAAIAIGQQLNDTIGLARIRGFLMSIMQNEALTANGKWDEKKVQSLADWFNVEFTLQSQNYLGARTGCSLGFTLSLALYTRKVVCRRDYILLFLACLRMAGAQARVVLSASVPSKRPAMNDLCPMSERKIKENAEKRLSNCAQNKNPLKNESDHKLKPDAGEAESSEPKDTKVPKNVKEEKDPREIKITPTKENVSQKPDKNTTEKVATRRVTRKALTTLNIPQLDGGDDEPAGELLPLRRSLRSKSASAVPKESPGSSPFTKRKSNTPGSSNGIVAKAQTIVTRKRKLFPVEPDSIQAVPVAPIKRAAATRSSARKQEMKKVPADIADATKQTKKPTRKTIGADTPSDDDAFDTRRDKATKEKASVTKSAAGGEPKKPQIKYPLVGARVPVVVLTHCPSKPVDRKVLSSDSSSEVESEREKSMKAVRKRQPKITVEPSAASSNKKKSKPVPNDSADNDSDFELPKESSKRKKKSSPTIGKAKKSPSVRRRTKSGEHLTSSDKTDIWIEFYCEKSKKWITFDIASERADCVDHIVRNASSPISYVFAWNNEGYLKDITARYVQNWNTACRMLRVEQAWLDKSLAPFVGNKTNRDLMEDKELNKLDADKPLPKTIMELKNHPLYALRRHLLKFEALYPAEPPTLGFIRGEAIYPRECVYTLHTREKWYKQGRVVRSFETAYKVVKSWKYDRPTNNWLKDQPCDLFGLWQTDDYEPPTAENGIVPRSEYGNVDLFTDKMLPKGTVHLKLPGLNKVCKRLQIDCAPAVTGFEMAKMRVVPVYEGFIVCQEFAEQVVEEWYKEMEQEDRREQEKKDKRVYGNWKRLIKGLLVRRKLQNKYNFDNLA